MLTRGVPSITPAVRWQRLNPIRDTSRGQNLSNRFQDGSVHHFSYPSRNQDISINPHLNFLEKVWESEREVLPVNKAHGAHDFHRIRILEWVGLERTSEII